MGAMKRLLVVLLFLPVSVWGQPARGGGISGGGSFGTPTFATNATYSANATNLINSSGNLTADGNGRTLLGDWTVNGSLFNMLSEDAFIHVQKLASVNPDVNMSLTAGDGGFDVICSGGVTIDSANLTLSADQTVTIRTLEVNDFDLNLQDFRNIIANTGTYHGNGAGLSNLNILAVSAVTNWTGLVGGYVSQDGFAAAEVTLGSGNSGFWGRPPPQTYILDLKAGTGYRTNILRFVFMGTNANPGSLVSLRVGQGSILRGFASRLDVQGTVSGTNYSSAANVPGACSLSVTNYSHATIGQTNTFVQAYMLINNTPSTNFQWFIGVQSEWYR